MKNASSYKDIDQQSKYSVINRPDTKEYYAYIINSTRHSKSVIYFQQPRITYVRNIMDSNAARYNTKRIHKYD